MPSSGMATSASSQIQQLLSSIAANRSAQAAATSPMETQLSPRQRMLAGLGGVPSTPVSHQPGSHTPAGTPTSVQNPQFSPRSPVVAGT